MATTLKQKIQSVKNMLAGVKLSEAKLEDGSIISFTGSKIEKGSETDKENGSYTLENGSTFSVVDGIVTETKEIAEEVKTEETPAEVVEVKEAEVPAPVALSKEDIIAIAQSLISPIVTALAELKTAFATQETVNQNTHTALSKITEVVEAIAGEPDPKATPIKKEVVPIKKEIPKEIKESKAAKYFN